MNNNNNYNNTEKEEQPFCGLQLMCLTPEEEEETYDNYDFEQVADYNWVDDSECQEGLTCILSLTPEECVMDSDNHIHSMDGIQLFFEEIGIIYDEPEPIDPSIDYEAEAAVFLEERNKTRKQHIEVTMPSLDDTTNSGISSTCSSVHDVDIRSYLGCQNQQKASVYAYSSHAFTNTSHNI